MIIYCVQKADFTFLVFYFIVSAMKSESVDVLESTMGQIEKCLIFKNFRAKIESCDFSHSMVIYFFFS